MDFSVALRVSRRQKSSSKWDEWSFSTEIAFCLLKSHSSLTPRAVSVPRDPDNGGKNPHWSCSVSIDCGQQSTRLREIIHPNNWVLSFSKGFQMIMQKPFIEDMWLIENMFIKWSLAHPYDCLFRGKVAPRTAFHSASGFCMCGLSICLSRPIIANTQSFSERRLAHRWNRIISLFS